MNRFKIEDITGRRKQAGVTLLIIIIAMLVIAVLGIAIYSMTYTATLNQVIAQRAAKAFYLAESGVRVASSEFRIVSPIDTAARDNKLISLQGLVFPMPNNQGQFSLDVSPDWVYAKTAQSGTSITLYFPGNVRSGLTFPTGGILKRNFYTSIAFFNNAPAPVRDSFTAPNGTTITFTFAANYPYTFQPNDEGYIGYAYTTTPSQQTVNSGDSLVLNNTNRRAEIFPPENGTIYVEHLATYPPPPNGNGQSYPVISQYTYDVRNPYVIDPSSPPATVTLQNLQAVSGTTAGFPLVILYNAASLTDITQTTRIYLGKTLTIQSTSTYGD